MCSHSSLDLMTLENCFPHFVFPSVVMFEQWIDNTINDKKKLTNFYCLRRKYLNTQSN